MTNAIATNAWNHPRTGETRHYIADIANAANLEINRYNSGGIRSASLNGEPISNRQAAMILGAKAWADATGKIAVSYYSGRENLTAILEAAIAKRGLDFIAATH